MERTLKVGGMTCDGCERSIVTALRRLAGVSDARADHHGGTVVVKLEQETPREALVGAIEDAGYDVLPDETRQLPMV